MLRTVVQRIHFLYIFGFIQFPNFIVSRLTIVNDQYFHWIEIKGNVKFNLYLMNLHGASE